MSNRRIGILLLSSLACITVAQAQTSSTTGAVRGVVSAKGGKVLAGAVVAVKSLETGFTRTTASNPAGEYTIGLLLVGRYEITVTAPGMRTIKNDNVTVALGKASVINVTMDKAEAAATVEVVATDAALDRTNVSTSVSIDASLVSAVPLNGRNFTDLVKLTPGAANDSSTGGGHEYIGGARDIYNNLTIDGASYNSSFYGGVRGSTSTPFAFGLDTIKELQVITDPYDPMYGNVAGGVINAVTKTGGNEVEGSALLQLRPSSLVAMRRSVPNDLSSGGVTNSATARTRSFSQQQYNFNVGGPIIKDRLFYFVGVESFHYSQSSTQALAYGGANTLADMNAFTSNFANVLVGGPGQPLSSQNGMGMTLDRKNPTVFARIDWQINENHRFDLRLNTQQFTNKNGSINGSTSPTILPSNDGTDYYNDISWVAELNSTFSGNMTNEARLQVSTERRPRTPNTFGSPQFGVSSGFTAGQIWYEPSNLNEFTKQFIDTFTVLNGDWTYKAGVDLQWFDFQNQFPQYVNGGYSFSNYAVANQWYSGQALTAGTATYTGAVSATNGWIVYSSNLLTGFVSVANAGLMNHRLNVVLGARITHEGAASNPRPRAALNGTDSPDSSTSVDPRFAFTYDLKGDGTTLIKGGYGWFTSPNPSLTVSNTMTANGNTISVYSIASNGNAAAAAAWAPGGILAASSVLNTTTGSLGTLTASQLQNFPAGTLTGQLWDPTNKMPVAKRASLGIEQKFVNGLTLGGRVEYAQFFNEQYFVNVHLGQKETDGTIGAWGDGYPTAVNSYTTTSRPATVVIGGRSVDLSAFGNVFLSENKGIGRYKALILTAARQSDNGFGFQSSVTFANTLDMNSNERITNGGISVNNDPANPRATFGPSDDDIRFRGVFAGYFPIYWGIKGVANLTYQSGLPYSAMASQDLNGDGSNSNDYALGYGGRNGRRQPAVKTFDFRLVRAFNIAKKVDLEASIDIYNVLNWANWTTSQTAATTSTGAVSPKFGLLDSADSNSREVQFGLRLKF